VPGRGAHGTSVIFFGDKPGPEEDKKGIPFIGETGILFDNLLSRVNINREEVYVDNIVSCWPNKLEEDRLVTRDPTKEEMRACLPRVWETVYRIDPLIIIAFGANALNALTGLSMKITAARGSLFFAYIPGMYKVVKSYPVFPTFHPAYALRRDRASRDQKKQSFEPKSIKDTILEDLVYARDLVLRLKLLYEGKA
jgi:DNA polymerase